MRLATPAHLRWNMCTHGHLGGKPGLTVLTGGPFPLRGTGLGPLPA